ncbi:MAG: hypothetical protein O7G84_01205 [Gammaproteobacteria bacterium]|nr:hypothetical protein [Gammaproteobacteria bacterium]
MNLDGTKSASIDRRPIDGETPSPLRHALDGDVLRYLTDVELSALTPLNEYKRTRSKSITQTTEALVSQGFEYPPGSGQIFSMSEKARIDLMELYQARNEVAYPLSYPFADESGYLDIKDAADMSALLAAMTATKRGFDSSDSTLKRALIAAADKTEVDLVVDER